MERTDLLDTSVEMHKVHVRMLREKGPEWRIQKAFELSMMSIEAFEGQTQKLIIRERPRAPFA